MKHRETYITWREFWESGFGLVVALSIVIVAWAVCKFAQEARVPGSWAYIVTEALQRVGEALG